MKIIILCAGKGSRMGELTSTIPKCLVRFQGKTILQYQLDIYKTLNINDISIVRGYQGNQLNFENIKYYTDLDGHNMIHSLFKAEVELNENLIISYGDILFDQEIIESLMRDKHDITVMSNQNWHSIYSARFNSEILSDVESFKIDNSGRLSEIGSKVKNIQEIEGQFMGLVKLTPRGCEIFKSFYHKNKAQFAGKPWIRGRNFEDCYTTDFVQGLIQDGIDVQVCKSWGGWLEFDTPDDLALYNRLISEKSINQYLKYDFMHS